MKVNAALALVMRLEAIGWTVRQQLQEILGADWAGSVVAAVAIHLDENTDAGSLALSVTVQAPQASAPQASAEEITRLRAVLEGIDLTDTVNFGERVSAEQASERVLSAIGLALDGEP